MASGMLPANSPYLMNGAGAFGFAALTIGAVGHFDRTIAWKVFAEEQPTEEARKLGDNFLLMWAGRDLFMGVVTTAAWYHNDRRAMGYILLASCLVCVQDGILSLRQLGRGQWLHWGCVPVFAGMGARLLQWL